MAPGTYLGAPSGAPLRDLRNDAILQIAVFVDAACLHVQGSTLLS